MWMSEGWKGVPGNEVEEVEWDYWIKKDEWKQNVLNERKGGKDLNQNQTKTEHMWTR